jgi:hypothetical protein
MGKTTAQKKSKGSESGLNFAARLGANLGPRNAGSFRAELPPNLKADFVPVRKDLANPCKHLAALLLVLVLATVSSLADAVYVTANFAQILRFDSSGGPSTIFGEAGGDVAGGLAVDGAGNLYAADHFFGAAIYKFSPAGVRSIFATTGLNHPSGLAFDPGGNLYAANYDNTIMKYTSSGTGSVFARGLNGPLGLAFDQPGNLYSANFGNGTIYKFTPGGTRSVFATGLSGPYGQSVCCGFAQSYHLQVHSRGRPLHFCPERSERSNRPCF